MFKIRQLFLIYLLFLLLLKTLTLLYHGHHNTITIIKCLGVLPKDRGNCS